MRARELQDLARDLVGPLMDELRARGLTIVRDPDFDGDLPPRMALVRESSSERRAAQCAESFVYFIRSGEHGLIKIGRALDVEARLRSLQTGSGEVLRLLLAIPPGGPREDELHARFAEHRRHGEWFDPAPELLAFIEESST